jgi:hypothetical protein
MLCQLSYGHHAIQLGWERLSRQEDPLTLPHLARGQGFEPRYAAPKAAVLPLNDPRLPGRFRCRGPDLNWGHRNFQSRALPTELPRRVSPGDTQKRQMADGRWSARGRTGISETLLSAIRAMRAGEGIRTPDLLLGKETYYRCTTPASFICPRAPTGELYLKALTCQEAPGALFQWTRPDSNRRSSPCKGDAFPLGHGPVSITTICIVINLQPYDKSEGSMLPVSCG